MPTGCALLLLLREGGMGAVALAASFAGSLRKIYFGACSGAYSAGCSLNFGSSSLSSPAVELNMSCLLEMPFEHDADRARRK